MKLRIALIAAFLALAFVAPAYAADKTYYTEPQKLVDDSGVEIMIDHVKVSDMPTGYSVFNYPPSQYQFYTLYYWLANPTDQRIRYQFRINFVDDKGRSYTSEEFNLAEYIDPNKKLLDMMQLAPNQKEFAVYRNATGVHLVWQHINHYWNNETATNISIVSEAPQTVTATPVPTVTATSMPTPTPVAATATPAPSSQLPCLSFLPMALLAGGFGAAGMVINRLGRR